MQSYEMSDVVATDEQVKAWIGETKKIYKDKNLGGFFKLFFELSGEHYVSVYQIMLFSKHDDKNYHKVERKVRSAIASARKKLLKNGLLLSNDYKRGYRLGSEKEYIKEIVKRQQRALASLTNASVIHKTTKIDDGKMSAYQKAIVNAVTSMIDVALVKLKEFDDKFDDEANEEKEAFREMMDELEYANSKHGVVFNEEEINATH